MADTNSFYYELVYFNIIYIFISVPLLKPDGEFFNDRLSEQITLPTKAFILCRWLPMGLVANSTAYLVNLGQRPLLGLG